MFDVSLGKANIMPLQVLAVDLLNPSPAAEAKKHKLKVRLQTCIQRPDDIFAPPAASNY